MHGLVCFDLDGTLLRGPTVCEVLATPLGRLKEMQRFETLTTEHEISLARLEMARWWYGEVELSDLLAHCKNAQLAPGAEEAIAQLQSSGIEVAIASITWKLAVAWFAERLDIRHYLGTEVTSTGVIEHVWGRTKGQWVRELARELAVPPTRIAAVGDSHGDADLLRAADLRFFVGERLPAEVDRVVHIPAADLREVSSRVVAAWSSVSSAAASTL
ncbi:MAG: HAD family hydrolase [Burkholderiaceae bacterium]